MSFCVSELSLNLVWVHGCVYECLWVSLSSGHTVLALNKNMADAIYTLRLSTEGQYG